MALVDKTSASTANTSEADSTFPAPTQAPKPSVYATDWNNDSVETAPSANNDIPTKDVGRCVKLAPPYSNELEGSKFSNKEICEDSAQETRRHSEPKKGLARKQPPKGTVETDPDDITVEKVPNYDEPNGDEIVGRPRDTKPTARTTEEKEKGSRARKMVERHMADAVTQVHGEKPTGSTSFDDLKTTSPPLSPNGLLQFGYKYSVGLLDALGGLGQHNRITNDSRHLARAYSAGFAHEFDGYGPSPEVWANGRTEQEIRAYRHGQRGWQQMGRWEQEEFRVGESVKLRAPLEQVTGERVQNSLMESWDASRSGHYRGRDE